MINTKKILAALKDDKTAATAYKQTKEAKIDKWKREYNGEPYGNEDKNKNKSSIVSRDIKKQREWQHPSIVDPFVSTADIVRCTPVTWEDSKAAEQNQLLLNYQFCRQFDRYNFMTKVLKVLGVEGTAIIQCGWEYEDEETSVEVDAIVQDEYGNEVVERVETTEIRVKKNRPTAVLRRIKDCYIDPTCMDNIDECQFIIVRYETSITALKKDGRHKNLGKIALSSSDYDYEPENEDGFTFKDDPRKKIVMHEYWGNYDVNEDGEAEPIVCCWVDDVVTRLESNPYPNGELPFIIVPFNSVPFDMYGESDAEYISENQKVKTAILRGFINNMAQSTNGQIGIKKNAIDSINLDRLEKGKNFQFNTMPSDIWQGSYNQIPNSAFDMLGLMNNEIESITGTKSFSGGITGNSLGTTATSARGVMDATSVRRINMVRNISENLVKPLMRKWMAYNSVFLSDKEVVRVTNDEFVPINRDDLAGRVDVEISVATAEDNAAKAQELAFMLQTMGNTLPLEVVKMLTVEHLKLTRQPEAAKALEEFKQEPDPMEEQMKQIQLERAMLENEEIKASIKDRLARAAENHIDARNKEAQAQEREAKAKLTLEKADREALAFIKEDEQLSQKAEIQREQIKADNAYRMKELEAKIEMLKKEYDNMHKFKEKEYDRQATLEVKEFDRLKDLDMEALKSTLNQHNKGQ